MIVLKPAARVTGRTDELAFSPDGSMLATPRGKGVLLWTTLANDARAELLRMPDGGGQVRLAFARTGRTLFAGNDQLFAFDLDSRAAVRVPTGKWNTVGFGVVPDGRLVVSEYQRGGESTLLTCWPAAGFKTPLWRTEVPAHMYLPPLFPPHGDVFVRFESARDPVTRYWRPHRVRRSLADGREVEASRQLLEHPEEIALSPDGELFATRVREHVYVYPAAGPWAVARSVPNDSKKHFTGIAFHPSGKYLAATSNDATVKLFDTGTWELARTFTWDVGRVRSVAFSPDGTLAAAGSDTGKVVVWDVDL